MRFVVATLIFSLATTATAGGRTAKKKTAPVQSKRVRAAEPAETLPPQPELPPPPPAPVESAEAAFVDPFSVPTENALNISVAHEMAVNVARERVQQLLNYWSDRFGIKSLWHGNQVFLTGSAWGFDIQARFDVGAQAVNAVAADPGRLMRSRVSSYVQNKLKKYLHPLYEEP